MKKEIGGSWEPYLQHEFDQPYFQKLEQFVDHERQTKQVFPAEDNVFAAFRLTPFDMTKVVILGQDPYHDVGQAHGLSFSVLDGVKHPPSLRNIFKELAFDQGTPTPVSGNLSGWAEQGVLLLNTVLTVEAHQANSHQKKGWETFTDAVIRLLGSREQHTVFVLWGKPAEKKEILIDVEKHTVIKSPHPSPLSARRGFFESRPFSRTNQALIDRGQQPIDWSVLHFSQQ